MRYNEYEIDVTTVDKGRLFWKRYSDIESLVRQRSPRYHRPRLSSPGRRKHIEMSKKAASRGSSQQGGRESARQSVSFAV